MPSRFLNNININDEYSLPSADGSADQIITTDGAGQLSFVDQSTISAGNAEHVVIYAKNTSGSSISKGTPVYITGTVGATDTVEIAPADAGNSAKMPAVGLLDDTLANNAFGYVITGGFMDNITTDPIDGSTPSSNDTVYVKAGGGLTLTKPTGSNLIQNVAKVGKVSGGNAGSLIVSSILRTNDVPNLTTGKIWVGSAANTIESATVHLDETNGRVGIGTTSPNSKLEVNVGTDQNVAINSHNSVARISSYNDAFTTSKPLKINGSDLRFDIHGSEKMRINSSGNVGIGTTSPEATFVVQPSQTSFNLAGISNGQIALGNNTFGGKAPTIGSKVTDTGQPALQIITGQPDNSTRAGIMFSVREDDNSDFSTTANKPAFQFDRYTSNLMTIMRDGNVGIGTTSPGTKLQISTTMSSTPTSNIFLDVDGSNVTGGGGSIIFGTSASAGTPSTYNAKITGTRVSGGAGGDSQLGFWTTLVSDTNVPQERMTITKEGDVGIGTTSPGYKLHVVGNVKITETAATSDTDKFVVLDSGVLKYRTGSQIISDLPTDSRYVAASGDTMSGSLDVNADIQANTFTQAATGIPRNNLGSPTVTEMALFDSQFTPKTTLANNYNDLTDLTFWVQTTSGSAWAEVTTYSDDEKRKFLRTNNSGVIIPNGAYKFRVEFNARYYTYANALYMYWSSQSHNTTVHIWKQRSDNDTWYQHTSSTQNVSSWPGHLWLPFSTIPWHETTSTTTHYHKIRVEFEPTWSTGTYADRDILLYGGQIWGGYPSGRRTPHYYDQNGKLSTWGDFDVNGTAIIDGNVGIGTTSPAYKLDVSSGSAVGARISTAGFSNLDLVSSRTSGNLGGIRFKQDVDAYQTGEFLSLHGGGFEWKTGNGAASPSTKMYINSSGNVGIGTTSPSAKLHVGNNSGGSLFYLNGQYNDVAFDGSTTGANGIWSFINSGTWNQTRFYVQDANNSNSRLTFRFTGNSGNNEILAGTSAGNVGIGTTSPSSKLQVNGDLTVGDDSTVGSFINVIAAGTSQDAGIRFGSESNTDSKAAIYTNTSNSDLHFDVTESTRMLIDSATGNVGIGTTSPAARLHVTGSGAGAKIHSSQTIGLEVSGGGNSQDIARFQNVAGYTKVTIDTDGNVGIGTTDPGTKLDVAVSATGKTWVDYAGTVGTFERNGDSNINIVSSNTGNGGVWFGDTDSIVRGRIRYEHASDKMEFWTSNSEKVSITSGGNVGIGVTSPAYKLDVDGEVRVGDNQKLKLWDDPFGAIITPLDAHLALTTTRTQDNIYFDPGNSTKMIIEGGGNVGIGVTSPSEKLDVNGTVNLTNLKISTAQGSDGQVLTSTGSGVAWESLPTTTQTIMTSNFLDSGSTTSPLRIPFNATNETTSNQYYNYFDVPADGTIKRIRMHNTSGSASTGFTTTILIYKNTAGGQPSYTSSAQTISNNAIEVDPDLSISKGDKVQIAYAKSAGAKYWQGVSASIIIEFTKI